jgi:DNA-binding XRE family transcriptional regulator
MTPDELRSSRNALGLTQAQLAKRIDVDPQTISNLERGVWAIDRRTELAVKHLGCKPHKKWSSSDLS